MRQRNQVRAGTATIRQPATAAELEKRLFGLGPFTLLLDGCRLTAPTPLRERLGTYCNLPFVFSIWHGPCLRIIPEAFWIPHLDSVRAGINKPGVAEELITRLEQTCRVGPLDDKHRWNLPPTLAGTAGLISGQNSVVLLPCRFWLEVLSAKAWESFVSETLQNAREADTHHVGVEI
jgi:DNA-binding transcriptional regulator/RsmH inhibitor MraZ